MTVVQCSFIPMIGRGGLEENSSTLPMSVFLLKAKPNKATTQRAVFERR